MQISRRTDPNKPIVFTTITGKITISELRQEIAQAEPSHLAPGLSSLVDLRDANADFNSNDLLEVAATIKQHPKPERHVRCALLVGSDLMYGLYRMFASFAATGPTDYRVFRDEAAAISWLEGQDSETDAESP